jgi:aminopeptidase N
MKTRLWPAILAAAIFLAGPASAQALFGPDSSARRNREFHALHYRLELSFDHRAKKVSGNVSIRLTPLSGTLDSVLLDAVAMEIRAIRLVGGRTLEFHERSPWLSIRLDRTYAFGETLAVSIDYTCSPAKGLYFIYADSGGGRHDQIWSQGEDMDNRYWFPCYDYPNDKATSEVIGTVAADWTLLSNGRLAGELYDKKNNRRTFHWVEAKPHSTYLIMVAAGRYAIVRGKYRNIPLAYYMYPEDTAKAGETFGRTPAMMQFFESKTGVPYPWEKFDQIIIDDFMWGGMENTTAVTLNDGCVVDSRAALDFPSDPVVAHELSHMWFGDIVTARDWTHLWLNEGFATYCEALWTEYRKGADEFQYEMIQASLAVRGNDRMLGRKPIVSHDSHPENLYARGAWVLHMLRSLLGDQAFWRGIHYYLTKYRFASAETDEFRLALEDATGQNLDWFFRQWVFGAGYPKLKVTKAWDESTHLLRLTVEQNQQIDSLTGYFRFPLVVECTTDSGNATRTFSQTFWVNRKEENFFMKLDGPPLMVIADKGSRVLKEMQFLKTGEEYVYQLNHASDVADRITAARSLPEYGTDPAMRDALAGSASSDPFRGVRASALTALAEIGNDSTAGVFLRATRDPSSFVRYTAARHLSNFKGVEIAARLDSMARNDSSYLVASTALRELSSVDTARAFEVAQALISRDSYRGRLRISSLSALGVLRDPRGISLALPYTDRRYDSKVRKMAVSVLGSGGKDSASARGRLKVLLSDPDPGIRTAAVAAVLDWKDPEFDHLLGEMESRESSPDVLSALKKALHPDPGEKSDEEK